MWKLAIHFHVCNLRSTLLVAIHTYLTIYFLHKAFVQLSLIHIQMCIRDSCRHSFNVSGSQMKLMCQNVSCLMMRIARTCLFPLVRGNKVGVIITALPFTKHFSLQVQIVSQGIIPNNCVLRNTALVRKSRSF